jgi:hypothetical protein
MALEERRLDRGAAVEDPEALPNRGLAADRLRGP